MRVVSFNRKTKTKTKKRTRRKKYQFKVLVSDQEDSTHKRFVVVQGVKVGGSQMEGAILRKHIMQVRIDRK